MLLSTMSLFSRSPSDRTGTLPSRAKDRSQNLVGEVFLHILASQRMVAVRRRKDMSLSPMSPTDSRSLKRRASTKLARLDFGLPPATSPNKRIGKSGRGEGPERLRTVVEPGSEKGVPLEKSHSARGTWKRGPSSGGTCQRMSRLLRELRELNRGHVENFVPEAMPAGYKLRRHPT